LARFRLRLSPETASILSFGVCGAIAALPVGLPFGVALGAGSTVIALLSAVIVFAAALDRRLVFEVAGLAETLEWLGARSYALYLVHPLVLRLVLTSGPLTGPKLAGFLLLTFAATEVSHRYVKRP